MTMLMPQTRSDALAHARYTYRALVYRAHRAAGTSRDYVAALAMGWDKRLADLPAHVAPLSKDEARVLDDLTAAVSDLELSTSALVEWVDAFPAAIGKLFSAASVALPGEFLTDLEWMDEMPIGAPRDEVAASVPVDAHGDSKLAVEAGAANKQPALALAA